MSRSQPRSEYDIYPREVGPWSLALELQRDKFGLDAILCLQAVDGRYGCGKPQTPFLTINHPPSIGEKQHIDAPHPYYLLYIIR